MIANFIPRKDLTVAEIFLAEKTMELVFKKTIDSYRARLHNPKTILKELYQVLEDYRNNKIKMFDVTVEAVKVEAIKQLEDDNELIFLQVDKKYIKGLLGSLKKDDYRTAQYAIQLVLADNKLYGYNLFEHCRGEINILNSLNRLPNPEEYNKLARLLNRLISELLSFGYSKDYLYQLIWKLFYETSTLTFVQSFDYLQKLSKRLPEDYTIVFSLRTPTSNPIDIRSRFRLDDAQISRFASINAKTTAFFERTRKLAGKGRAYYLGIQCQGRDYFSVIREARKIHGSVVDTLHLGFPNYQIESHSTALVIGTLEPSKATDRTADYIIDGNFQSNQELYDKFTSKLIEVVSNDKVSVETKSKLVSAVRYLRLGWEASELEQKFVNFWIGLEYVFSNYDIDENTIKRMKTYFVNAHCLIYLKRNLHEFHSDIKRLKLQGAIPNFNEDMRYLKQADTYDYIMHHYAQTNPLLAFRAFHYKEWITNETERVRRISRHHDNLDRHLTRLYRIRNEIVHDATIHANIEVLTGNLRYYLSFVLNSLLEYFTHHAVDLDRDGYITIDDFFVHQMILLDSIKQRKYPLDDLLNVKSVTEIFS